MYLKFVFAQDNFMFKGKYISLPMNNVDHLKL